MQTISIREIRFGEGIPKICVPIVGKTKDEIQDEALKIKELPVDIVEWRVDWYEESKCIPKVIKVAHILREILGNIPILFTIRTCGEGGETSYSQEEYQNINLEIAKTGYVDIVDVEIFFGIEELENYIASIQATHTRVIASNHEFTMTPNKEEIIRRLVYMQEMGADILKLAVMPQDTRDVLVLLDATREMVEEKACKPVVTMSMGALGVISRISGETFGSAMTFGAGEKVSAPGQISAVALHSILKNITND